MSLKSAIKSAFFEEATGGGGDVELPAVKIVTWSNYVQATTVTTVNLSAHIATGDLLVLTILHRSALTSVPSGFTLVASGATVGTADQITSVYAKVADGTETSFSVTQAVSERLCINCAVWEGSKTPVIVGAVGTMFDVPSTSYVYTLPALTSPAAGKLGVMVIAASWTFTGGTQSTTNNALNNIPPYTWTALHNTNGTSTSQSNRMAIWAKPTLPGISTATDRTDWLTATNLTGNEFSVVYYTVIVPD